MEPLIDLLKGYDFIIADFATKKELLKWHQSHPFLKLKIYTPEDILSAYLGSVDEKATLKIMAHFDLSFEHTKILLKNIVFEKTHDKTHKTKLLSDVRAYLIEQGLLYRDPLCTLLFGNKKVLIFSYLTHHKVLMHILKTLNTEMMVMPFLTDFKPPVFQYKNGIEETYDTLNKIATLLNQGVPAHRLKIMVINKEYDQLLRFLAPSFNVLLQPEARPLIVFSAVTNLLEVLFEGMLSLDMFIAELKAASKNELIAFYNALVPFDLTGDLTPEIAHLIRDVAKSTTISLFDNDGIEVLDTLPQWSDKNTFYFFMNFVQGTAPQVEQISPFLSLTERQLLAMLTPEDIGQMGEEKLVYSLQNIPNLTLSWSPILGDEIFYASPLQAKLSLQTEEGSLPLFFYSQQYLNYLTGANLDQKRTYNVIEPLLSTLYYSNPKRDAYQSFDYQFKGISYTHPRLSLSYSSINLYQQLPFDYFAEKLLHLQDDSRQFSLLYGSFVHKVLETSKDDPSFEVCFNYYVDQFDFSMREKFFVHHQKPIVKATFAFFNEYRRHAQPTTILNEQSVKLTFDLGFDFVGRLDRVLLFEKNGLKAAVIMDFKTGKAESRPDYYEHGLDLQLPLYGLLLKKDPTFAGYTPGALVICSMKTGAYILGDQTLLQDTLKGSLKFKGLVLNNPQVLAILDRDYLQSSFFAGVRYNKTQNELAGVIDKESLESYTRTAERMIKETHAAILRNEFPVKVKLIKDKLSGGHSAFREISYIPEIFNGGDNDDEA